MEEQDKQNNSGLVLVIVLGIMLLLPLLSMGGMIMSAGGEAAIEPVIPVATEDKAEEYQYVGSELGISWEITILVDAIMAYQDEIDSIEEFNPLLTALEFCKLVEIQYDWVEEEGEDGILHGRWEYSGTETYTACDEILSYIDADREEFGYKEASALVAALQDKAEEKSRAGRVKYEITLLANTEYEMIMRDYIGLKDENIAGVMELYDAHYLAYLYGYMTEEDDELIEKAEVELPALPVSGEVTRDELARVAASIMNWPYLLGGKSSAKGKPTGPLDCSGYVDWVYIQCFGKGVSAGGGRLPSGVAVSGTAIQFYASDQISESELKVGDLGFMKRPEDVKPGGYNHVGIYVGEIGGKHAWIHCGGSSFGYEERPRGRVGISTSSGTNATNCITGGSFSPPMKACNFTHFRRPRFQFKDDVEEETEDIGRAQRLPFILAA